MQILQPAEWSKPRGFSHGVEFNGAGRWVVLAGQTGGEEKGDYPPDMAAQVGAALKRIIKLLAEAGAGPEHIVRLTWYLTSRSEYEAAGAGSIRIGAPLTVSPGSTVRSEMLALKLAALATTAKLPPPPRPSRLPPMLRLDSVQFPETAPPWSTTLACRLNL